MDRHQPGAVELPVANSDHCVGEVDIAALEAHGFSDTHAGGREQAEESTTRGRTKLRLKQACSIKEALDIFFGPQVRRGALLAGSEDIARGDLGRRIDRLQISGEPACRAEPVCPVERLHVLGQLGPSDRQVGGDRLCARRVDVLDERGQQTARIVELEAQ